MAFPASDLVVMACWSGSGTRPRSRINGSCVFTEEGTLVQACTEAGGIIAREGICVCPAGTVVNDGYCVPASSGSSSGQPAQPPVCIGGTVSNGTCQCQSGETVENGICTFGGGPPVGCSGGSMLNGECVCPNGNVNPTGGNCLTPPPMCNGGTFDLSGDCNCGPGVIIPAPGGTCP